MLKNLHIAIRDGNGHKVATYWVAACVAIHVFAMQCEADERSDNELDAGMQDLFIIERLSSDADSDSDSIYLPAEHTNMTHLQGEKHIDSSSRSNFFVQRQNKLSISNLFTQRQDEQNITILSSRLWYILVSVPSIFLFLYLSESLQLYPIHHHHSYDKLKSKLLPLPPPNVDEPPNMC